MILIEILSFFSLLVIGALITGLIAQISLYNPKQSDSDKIEDLEKILKLTKGLIVSVIAFIIFGLAIAIDSQDKRNEIEQQLTQVEEVISL